MKFKEYLITYKKWIKCGSTSYLVEQDKVFYRGISGKDCWENFKKENKEVVLKDIKQVCSD